MAENAGAVAPMRIRRLLVSSPKGGVGKTTLSRNLAVAAVNDADYGIRLNVATIDLDRQQSLTKWWIKRQDLPGAAPIVHYRAAMHEAMDILKEVTEHDLVILDTPPGVEDHPEQIKGLLFAADLVLIPTQVGPDDLDSVIEWMRLVQGMGKRGLFVLNRVNRRARSVLTAKRRLMTAGPLCSLEIPHYESFVDAAAAGVGVMEIRGGQGADDIFAVWRQIRAEIGLVPSPRTMQTTAEAIA